MKYNIWTPWTSHSMEISINFIWPKIWCSHTKITSNFRCTKSKTSFKWIMEVNLMKKRPEFRLKWATIKTKRNQRAVWKIFQSWHFLRSKKAENLFSNLNIQVLSVPWSKCILQTNTLCKIKLVFTVATLKNSLKLK